MTEKPRLIRVEVPLVTNELLQSEPHILNGLNCRAANCLFNMTQRHPWAGCCEHLPNPKTVAALLMYSPTELWSYPGLGRKTLAHIVSVLAMHGLKLAPTWSARTTQ